MNNTFTAIGFFFLGFGVGILFSVGVVETFEYISPSDTQKLVSDCEQSLPRNQKCVLIAIPEKSNHERI